MNKELLPHLEVVTNPNGDLLASVIVHGRNVRIYTSISQELITLDALKDELVSVYPDVYKNVEFKIVLTRTDKQQIHGISAYIRDLGVPTISSNISSSKLAARGYILKTTEKIIHVLDIGNFVYANKHPENIRVVNGMITVDLGVELSKSICKDLLTNHIVKKGIGYYVDDYVRTPHMKAEQLADNMMDKTTSSSFLHIYGMLASSRYLELLWHGLNLFRQRKHDFDGSELNGLLYPAKFDIENFGQGKCVHTVILPPNADTVDGCSGESHALNLKSKANDNTYRSILVTLSNAAMTGHINVAMLPKMDMCSQVIKE